MEIVPREALSYSCTSCHASDSNLGTQSIPPPLVALHSRRSAFCHSNGSRRRTNESASVSVIRRRRRSLRPTTPSSAFRTSSRSAVKATFGPGGGKVTRLTRSAGVRRSSKVPAFSVTMRAPKGWTNDKSTAISTSRPGGALALLLKPGGRASKGTAPSVSRAVVTNSSETARRGLPSTSTWKSSARRSRTGRPPWSTTVTSRATTSTSTGNSRTGTAAS